MSESVVSTDSRSLNNFDSSIRGFALLITVLLITLGHDEVRTHPRASVVGTVDKSEAAAEWSQQTFGIPGFPDLATAIAKTSADAVLLEHFIESIERGQQPEPSIEDNRKTLAVVFGSLESVLKKEEVRL